MAFKDCRWLPVVLMVIVVISGFQNVMNDFFNNEQAAKEESKNGLGVCGFVSMEMVISRCGNHSTSI